MLDRRSARTELPAAVAREPLICRASKPARAVLRDTRALGKRPLGIFCRETASAPGRPPQCGHRLRAPHGSIANTLRTDASHSAPSTSSVRLVGVDRLRGEPYPTSAHGHARGCDGAVRASHARRCWDTARRTPARCLRARAPRTRATTAFNESPSRATVKGFGTVDSGFGAASANGLQRVA